MPGASSGAVPAGSRALMYPHYNANASSPQYSRSSRRSDNRREFCPSRVSERSEIARNTALRRPCTGADAAEPTGTKQPRPGRLPLNFLTATADLDHTADDFVAGTRNRRVGITTPSFHSFDTGADESKADAARAIFSIWTPVDAEKRRGILCVESGEAALCARKILGWKLAGDWTSQLHSGEYRRAGSNVQSTKTEEPGNDLE